MFASDRTLLSYLRTLAETQPDVPALGNGERWMNASELLCLVEHTGTALRRMGLGCGAYVAFRCTRTVEAAILLFGLRAAGAVAVLTDPRQCVEEALAQADTPIQVSAVIEQMEGTVFSVKRCEPDAEAIMMDLFSLAPSSAGTDVSDPDAPAFVIFTSGSTGKSKAVVLSEGNLVSNLLDSLPLGDYQDGDLALCALPLHHVFGLVLLAGCAVLGYGVCIPAKNDVPYLLSVIQSQHLTRMNGVPSLYQAMAEQCGGYDISSMRSGFVGGSPMTEKQFGQVEDALGMTLIPVYGMSECIGIACGSFEDSRALRSGTVGRFYAMNTGLILHDDGTEAAPLEEGEICVRGPMRMLGYYGALETPEQLLHTGDLGYVDADGYLHITGRKKNIIIRNGNNLSPLRIEEALMAIPGVRSAVVVGLPDERQGEVPAAMLVTDCAIGEITPALGKHELPVLYHFVDHLPLTASGKPDRQSIREVLSACRNG